MEKSHEWMEKYSTSHQILEHLTQQLVSIKNYHSTLSCDEIFKKDLTFKNISWYEIIIPILSERYPSNKHINIGRNIGEKIYGGKVWLNHRFRDKFVEDILHFNFERLFPEVIWNLYHKGDLKFNNTQIGDLFGDLLNITNKDIELYVDNRAGLRSDQPFNKKTREEYNYDVDNRQNKIINEIKTFKTIIINRFYGLLSNPKNEVFYCEDFNIIPKYCHNLLNVILEEFKNDIVYLDTDSIYFRYSSSLDLKKLKKILELSELPYTFENGIEYISNVFDNILREELLNGYLMKQHSTLFDGIFSDKRRYILFDKQKQLVRMSGFPTYQNKMYDFVLDNKINKKYKEYQIE